jgi:hypothetical protein
VKTAGVCSPIPITGRASAAAGSAPQTTAASAAASIARRTVTRR